jgi:murein L,D-transpeptidase YcbB/YkuD
MVARAFAIALTLLWGAAPLAAQSGALRIDINIPAQRLVVYEGDKQIRSYPVSTGMKGHDTPTGNFTISHAEWNPWWRPPARDWAKDDKITPPGPNNPMGRVKLFFMPYYFVHGSPEEGDIGTPASHGCVRMFNKDAIALARLIHERVAPQITPKMIDGILAKSRTTREVYFKRTVPLTIRYDPIVVENGNLRIYPDFYGYHAIHTEAVYQALIAAGYDVKNVKMGDVQKLVKRAKEAKSTFAVPLSEAFGGAVVASLDRGTGHS